MGKDAYARNRAVGLRWLKARARGYSGRSLPRAKEIEAAVREMPEWCPVAHRILHRCYLASDADPKLPAKWRARFKRAYYEGTAPSPLAVPEFFWLHHLEDALFFVAYTLCLADEQRAARRDQRERRRKPERTAALA